MDSSCWVSPRPHLIRHSGREKEGSTEGRKGEGCSGRSTGRPRWGTFRPRLPRLVLFRLKMSELTIMAPLLGRPDLHSVLTKLHVFRLTPFTKIIFLDADVLPLKPLSHLFAIPSVYVNPSACCPLRIHGPSDLDLPFSFCFAFAASPQLLTPDGQTASTRALWSSSRVGRRSMG
jgi:hypothetical protein